MRKLLFLFLLAPFLLFGFVLGALNSDKVVLDIVFSQPAMPLGVLVLLSLLLGSLLTLLFLGLFVFMPIQRRLRQAEKMISRQALPGVDDFE